MAEHPSKRTLTELDQIIQDVQYFCEHPRIQQNRWVAKGETWIPTLQRAKQDLESEIEHYDIMADAYQAVWLVVGNLGLELQQRDRTTWGYSWHGMPLVGAFPSRTAALEAALRERLPETSTKG